MYGLAKLPRINPGTALNNRSLRSVLPPEQLEELQQVDQEDLWGLERKYDVDVTEIFGGDRIAPGPVTMRGLVVLEWSRKASGAGFSRMRVKDRPEALDSCMKSPGLFYLPPDGAPAAGRRDYLELLGDCPLLLAEGGVDFSSAAAECNLMLGSAAEDGGRP
jgi:HprK-related kinase B